MKIVIPKSGLLWTALPITLSIGFFLFWFYTGSLQFIDYAFWLPTIVLFFLIIFPSRKIIISPPENTIPRYSLIKWIARVFLLQIFLIFIFWGMCGVIGNDYQMFGPHQPDLFAKSTQHFALAAGLFPWNIIAILTIGFSIVSYHQKKNAYLSTTILKQNINSNFSHIINFVVRLGSIFVFSSTLATVILATTLICFMPLKTIFGFHQTTFLFVLIIVVIVLLKPTKKLLMALFRKRLPFFVSLPIFCLIFTVLLIIADHLLSLTATPTKSPSLPEFIEHFLKPGWINLWQIWALLWWAIWTPAVAAIMAYEAKGRKIWQIILVQLTLPIFLFLIIFLFQHTNFFHYVQSTLVAYWCAWIGFIGLMVFYLHHENFSLLMQGYLPKDGQLKYRDYHLFLLKCVRATSVFFYLFLPVGIILVTMTLFSLIYLLPIFLLLSSLMLPYRVFSLMQENK